MIKLWLSKGEMGVQYTYDVAEHFRDGYFLLWRKCVQMDDSVGHLGMAHSIQEYYCLGYSEYGSAVYGVCCLGHFRFIYLVHIQGCLAHLCYGTVVCMDIWRKRARFRIFRQI